MPDVSVLPTARRDVEQSLVAVLEDLLVMAKNGEIIAAACGVVYADRHTGSFASQNQCASQQIGAVAILLQELTQDAIDTGGKITVRPTPDEPATD